MWLNQTQPGKWRHISLAPGFSQVIGGCNKSWNRFNGFIYLSQIDLDKNLFIDATDIA